MILRETGANQSLLLESTLLLSGETSTGVNVLIQGIEVEPAIQRCIWGGNCCNLPVKGIDLTLGNDLARGKVSADPCVTNISLCQYEAVSEDTTIYPACAITRAIARANEQKDNVSYSGQEGVTVSHM